MRTRFVLAVCMLLLVVVGCGDNPQPVPTVDASNFRISAAPEIKLLDDAGIFTDFAQSPGGFPIYLTLLGSVDMRLKIEAYTASNPGDVDAFWGASALWMPGSFVREKASIMRTVTVFAVDTQVAEELGWTTADGITMEEVIAGINTGKIRLAMPSASQDDAGAIAYLAALSALDSDSETLRMEDLNDPSLVSDMTTLFSAVERSASRSDLLRTLFVNDQVSGDPQYNSLFVSESMAIAVNQDLIAQNAEPLTVFYVQDAIGMETFPLGYTKDVTPEKREQFATLIAYLRTPEVQKRIAALGFRTGYIGLRVEEPDPTVFNQAWGIETDRDFRLIDLPKDDVITAALTLYQTALRSGSFTSYCLDYSPSMDGEGIQQLYTAMNMLLDQEQASLYLLQASPKDTTVTVLFDGGILAEHEVEGNDPTEMFSLYEQIQAQNLGSATNIYGCAIRALEYTTQASSDQLPAVILLTDGEHNAGRDFEDLAAYYAQLDTSVPIYGILMGGAVPGELQRMADLSNGAVCDGRGGVDALASCFRLFKGSN